MKVGGSASDTTNVYESHYKTCIQTLNWLFKMRVFSYACTEYKAGQKVSVSELADRC